MHYSLKLDSSSQKARTLCNLYSILCSTTSQWFASCQAPNRDDCKQNIVPIKGTKSSVLMSYQKKVDRHYIVRIVYLSSPQLGMADLHIFGIYILHRHLLHRSLAIYHLITGGHMSAGHCRKVYLLAFVICFAVLLFLAMSVLSISIMNVLEIFLMAFGVLLIVWAVSKVDDQIHLHKVRQRHREIALQRQRRQRPPLHGR